MALDWSLPYASRRSPVFAHNVVATSQPLAVQAGIAMLRAGGNAVDAALAAAIALTVVEPTGNGIGSDAFAMVWDGKTLHGLNGSGRSPRAWTPEYFKDRPETETGWDTVTVPGAVDAWISLSRRFGALPFAELFVPALHYAKHGFAVTPRIQAAWKDSPERLSGCATWTTAFMPDGRVPEVGERFILPGQAETLKAIAQSEGEAFYRGDLAERIAAFATADGGLLRTEDLAAHHSQWVTPVSIDYDNVRVFELPPNGHGIAALVALGILRELEIKRFAVDSVDSMHLQIEAMKTGLREVFDHVADPAHMRVRAEDLITAERIAGQARRIKLERAIDWSNSNPKASGGTVYLVTADAHGMMVSYIQSNYQGFGSGLVVPGTGISLHNRGAGFTRELGHPNCIDGGKLPYHTIMPGFVCADDGTPLVSFGVMGKFMQPQGHVQMITRIVDYGQNPQAASDAPRWFVDEEFKVHLEPGVADATYAELKRRGHEVIRQENARYFGGAQLAYRLSNGFYCAASDHRKDGQAAGF